MFSWAFGSSARSPPNLSHLRRLHPSVLLPFSQCFPSIRQVGAGRPKRAMGCLFLAALSPKRYFSSSTSHLFPQQRREQQQQPLEDVRKRFSSSEGRFSIIDERSKDSSSSDTDDEPLPNLFSVPHRIPPPSSFSRSVELPAGTMASATSRFRIVPVESRYKRGRWECFDYYQKEVTRCPKISCPALPPPNIPKTDRFVRSWTTDLVPPATAPPSQGPSFKFEVSSDSDRENSDPTPRKKVPTDVVVPSGRMTPTEMLQTGLESTLNTSDIKKDVAIIDSSATSHNGNSPAMVAIDSKIEQAMDLVKTHLMYAVREEVDVLRQKIGDLEAHIHQLESENAVLREHVPTDVLGGLHGK